MAFGGSPLLLDLAMAIFFLHCLMPSTPSSLAPCSLWKALTNNVSCLAYHAVQTAIKFGNCMPICSFPMCCLILFLRMPAIVLKVHVNKYILHVDQLLQLPLAT